MQKKNESFLDLKLKELFLALAMQRTQINTIYMIILVFSIYLFNTTYMIILVFI